MVLCSIGSRNNRHLVLWLWWWYPLCRCAAGRCVCGNRHTRTATHNAGLRSTKSNVWSRISTPQLLPQRRSGKQTAQSSRTSWQSRKACASNCKPRLRRWNRLLSHVRGPCNRRNPLPRYVMLRVAASGRSTSRTSAPLTAALVHHRVHASACTGRGRAISKPRSPGCEAEEEPGIQVWVDARACTAAKCRAGACTSPACIHAENVNGGGGASAGTAAVVAC